MGVNILFKWNPVTTKLQHTKHLQYHRQYYSMVDISFLWEGGGGGPIYYGIIN